MATFLHQPNIFTAIFKSTIHNNLIKKSHTFLFIIFNFSYLLLQFWAADLPGGKNLFLPISEATSSNDILVSLDLTSRKKNVP